MDCSKSLKAIVERVIINFCYKNALLQIFATKMLYLQAFATKMLYFQFLQQEITVLKYMTKTQCVALNLPVQDRINHSLILSREGLILTLSILPCPQGWIS